MLGNVMEYAGIKAFKLPEDHKEVVSKSSDYRTMVFKQ